MFAALKSVRNPSDRAALHVLGTRVAQAGHPRTAHARLIGARILVVCLAPVLRTFRKGDSVSLDRISIRGAREHNLKGIDLEIPRDKLVVITGLSGSGKCSLAFDTIYAEGQRRYVESLSAYARQFLGQMDKPDVDHIEGLSPAVSIDQKTTSKNPRSTVGTVTEIYDYLRLLFARDRHPALPDLRPRDRAADARADRRPHPRAGRGHEVPGARAGRQGPQGRVRQAASRTCKREGFTRVRVDGEVRELDEEIVLDKKYKHDIDVVVDRLVMKDGIRARLADCVETALRLADGTVVVAIVDGEELLVLAGARVPGARRLDGRARAARLLVQQPVRRVPRLRRASARRLEADPRPRRARRVAARSRRARSRRSRPA